MRLQVFLVLFVFSYGSVAQEAANVPPVKFPLSFRAPENAAWTIKVTSKQKSIAEEQGAPEEQKKVPFVESLTVTKTGPIYHEVASVKDGRSWEKWIFRIGEGDMELIKYAGNPNWERLSGSGAEIDSSNYRSSDFESFQWMTEKNYQGVSTIDDKPVYKFEMENMGQPLTRREASDYDFGAASSALMSGQTYGQKRTVTGYLSVGDQLPRRFESDREVRDYTFIEAPATRLSPPTDVIAALSKWLEERKAYER